MNIRQQQHRIEIIENIVGNRYAAVNLLANKTRKLSRKYRYKLLDSEVLSWIITGNKPDSAYVYDKILSDKREIESISMKYALSVTDEVLCYVDDEGVKKSVKACIKASRECNHLIYVYIDVDSEYQKSRVRVLTRIIWYSL